MAVSSRRITNLLAFAIAAIACCAVSQLAVVDGFSTGGAVSSSRAPTSTTTMTTTPTTTTTTTRLSVFRNTAKSTPPIVQGIGEEGCALPSPSGLNTQNEGTQALAVKGIVFALFGATYAFNQGLAGFPEFAAANNFGELYDSYRSTWSIAFGAIFTLAGITHFTLKEEYENIYPIQGAWGVYNIPGSKEFHVAWTGAAELLGGLGLLAGRFAPMVTGETLAPLTRAGLESDCAAALCLLTLVVTPANIYMYTHGARLPMEGGPIPVKFHAVRFVMQVVLLGFLYQMGEETFTVLFCRSCS